MSDSPKCEVCGADLTGCLSLERHDVQPVQRVTCYGPEDCADRLMMTRDAWKSLAHALRKRDRERKNEALARLAGLGEITLKTSKSKAPRAPEVE